MTLLPVHTALSTPVWVNSFPESIGDVIRSDLNYSVVLQCWTTLSINPVLHWTFNGKPCWTEDRLIIRRLSREHLGSYVCVVTDNQKQHSSSPVNISLSGEAPLPSQSPAPQLVGGQPSWSHRDTFCEQNPLRPFITERSSPFSHPPGGLGLISPSCRREAAAQRDEL